MYSKKRPCWKHGRTDDGSCYSLGESGDDDGGVADVGLVNQNGVRLMNWFW